MNLSEMVKSAKKQIPLVGPSELNKIFGNLFEKEMLEEKADKKTYLTMGVLGIRMMAFDFARGISMLIVAKNLSNDAFGTTPKEFQDSIEETLKNGVSNAELL